MKNFVPNGSNIEDILPLLSALDGGLLRSLQGKGLPIIVVTATSAPPHVNGTGHDSGGNCADPDQDELEDDEGCCPEYEPSSDGTGRCAYACPVCGVCLRQHIGEEFE